MDSFINNDLLRELANSVHWREVDRYIDNHKENIKQKLITTNPEDVVKMSKEQGVYQGLSMVQSLVNKYKGDE